MTETKPVQIINLSKSNIEDIAKYISNFDLSEVWLFPKSRGYDFSMPLDKERTNKLLELYWYYRLMNKINSDLQKQIENYTYPLVDTSNDKTTVTLNNTYSISIEQSISTKADVWSALYELEVEQNQNIYSNYKYFQESIENNKINISKTNLFELLSDKWFNDDYISKNLADYLEKWIRETLSINVPIILNNIDINENYNIIYNDFLLYDNSQLNWEYDLIEILEYYKLSEYTLSQVKSALAKFEKEIKWLYTEGEDTWFFKILENKTEVINIVDNIFYTKQGNEKFLIHHLFEKFNLNYDEIKEFFNTRSYGSLSIAWIRTNTYTTINYKMKVLALK